MTPTTMWRARAINTPVPADLPSTAMTVALHLDAALRTTDATARESALRAVLDELDALTRHVRVVWRVRRWLRQAR